MTGNCTRIRVEEYAHFNGLDNIQIDGIPEQFSFKEPDVTISDKFIKGQYVAFIPLSNWVTVKADTIHELKEKYKIHAK